MSVHQDQLVKNIQSAVAASPELQKQLAAAQSHEQAADFLSKAMGASVTAADLLDLSKSAQSQMTDEQLEAVSAGGQVNGLAIFCSIVSVGVACAAASLAAEIVPVAYNCKGYFKWGG